MIIGRMSDSLHPSPLSPSPAAPAGSTAVDGAVRLTDWGVIRAEGEDAAKFLHSQLTQDLALQTTSEARLAGFCSAKGRLLATMLAVKADETTVLLAVPADVLPALLKRLSMFVLRAKCRLSDASADWAVWGWAGASAQAALGAAAPAQVWSVGRTDGGALATRLPDEGQTLRFMMLQPVSAAAPDLPAIDLSTWNGLEVAAGLVWIRQATVEQFVPQMVNLELVGGVNFKKGCYPGQEVVARSQYRGTIKRRTHRFVVDGDAAPGEEVFHSSDAEQPAGMVAAVGRADGRTVLLAEVKLALLESGTLHLRTVDGPVLTQQPLPYVIGEPE